MARPYRRCGPHAGGTTDAPADDAPQLHRPEDQMADVAETIEESGRRIGRHSWVEARLFEIVGS